MCTAWRLPHRRPSAPVLCSVRSLWQSPAPGWLWQDKTRRSGACVHRKMTMLAVCAGLARLIVLPFSMGRRHGPAGVVGGGVAVHGLISAASVHDRSICITLQCQAWAQRLGLLAANWPRAFAAAARRWSHRCAYPDHEPQHAALPRSALPAAAAAPPLLNRLPPAPRQSAGSPAVEPPWTFHWMIC